MGVGIEYSKYPENGHAPRRALEARLRLDPNHPTQTLAESQDDHECSL